MAEANDKARPLTGPDGMGTGTMLLISGPSGCGKSTICRLLLDDARVQFSVSATTRPIRKGELDGRDYYFLTPEEFNQRIEAGEFIEYADVYGHMYGTLREPMEKAVAAGNIYLVEIDVQGALQLMSLKVPGIYVFVAAPSFEELRRRLVERGTEALEVIERRLKKAEDEYAERSRYDYVIVNDDLEAALREVRRVVGLDGGIPAGGRQS